MPNTKNKIFEIVGETEDYFVIEKLQSFLSQKAEASSKEALPEFISRTLKRRVWPVHRLDREVRGLMLFAKSDRACQKLMQYFRERKIKKKYWAWVYGRAPESKTRLTHYLSKNTKTNFVTAFPRPTEGAKEATLEYHKIAERGSYSLVEVDLHTGRSHQIRVQLSKEGHPILGDQRYFTKAAFKRYGEPLELGSILLFSVFLGVPQEGVEELCCWELPDKKSKIFEISL